jgi:hypothetical protein
MLESFTAIIITTRRCWESASDMPRQPGGIREITDHSGEVIAEQLIETI